MRHVFKKKAWLSLIFFFPFVVLSQSTYLPQADKANILLERWEIKAKTDSILNFSKTKPLSRKQFIQKAINKYYENDPSFSRVDQYNLHSILLNNQEYLSNTDELPPAFKSKKTFLKKLYTTPANMYEVHIPDFDLVINPVIQVVVSKESGNDETLYLNTRGLNLRGRIAQKIGFYAYVTDNQEKDPLYVRQWVSTRKAVPGQGFFKSFKKTGYDYLEATGYFTFRVGKYVDVAFGYDRHFIGTGYRSLFLGNSGTSNLFLKLKTRLWKFDYQNLFMELHSAGVSGGDILLPKKYATLHHLDLAVTKWLNIGLFEGVIFGRKDRFSLGYLNPVIFFRTIVNQDGAYDNSVAGLDFKANLARKIQLYGQFSLDELQGSGIKKDSGYWANKWGIQIGAKYIDAFGVKNLDLQLEHNRVRPFTYAHFDSVANYTHYNQPLAHQLGANFKETISIARYQPLPKWMIVARYIFYTQGMDSSSRSFGSNIVFPDQLPFRTGDYGYYIGSGWKTNVSYASFLLSYEWRENFFLEFNAVYRKQETKTPPLTSSNTLVLSFGLRWNMHHRNFEF